jgi:hypothetical protein
MPRRDRAIVGAALAGVLLTACGTPADNGDGAPVASVPSVPSVDLTQRPIADDPDPALRSGAVANFLECEHGVWQGGWGPDYGFLASGPNPDAALAVLLDERMLALPTAGFVAAGVDEGRVLYTYRVGTSTKAAVVVANETKVTLGSTDEWSVESFASCDPAEFDASADESIPMTVWTDAAGERVPTSVITSYRGPEHCGWESATFLTVDDTAYISDPEGVLGDRGFVVPFDGDTELPPDAIDTGYEQAGRHLWLSPDRTIAFVVTDERVEAWPSATEQSYCA